MIYSQGILKSMFEKALFEKVKNDFRVRGFNIDLGYGEISANTAEPYIIQYSLDMDGTRQFLCNNDNFSDGVSFVQWNIYAGSISTSDFIYQQLFKFIQGLKKVGNYDIGLNLFQSNRNFPELNNGLAMSALAMQINYYKEI